MKRTASLIAILVIISMGCFYLVHLLPGNPAAVILPQGTPEQLLALDRQLGLDKPIYIQYFIWLGHVLHGNLGVGSRSGVPVSTLIGGSFKLDVELIVISQLMAFLVAPIIAIK